METQSDGGQSWELSRERSVRQGSLWAGCEFRLYLSMCLIACVFAGAAHGLGGATVHADEGSEEVRWLWARLVSNSQVIYG